MTRSGRHVLLVGMPNSVHIARICRALRQGGWQVHLFPCHDARPHPELRDVIVYDPAGSQAVSDAVEIRRVFPASRLAHHATVRASSLAAVVRTEQPVLVHAHEIQHSGYLAVTARKLSAGRFPPLLVSAWGSDVSLQGRLPHERRRIVDVLRHCDVFTGECERDIRHARRLGFRGETFLPRPIAGGFDLDHLRSLRAKGPTSARRTIALKGYQGWAGRAQVGLRALEICAPLLAGYRIGMYLAGRDEEGLSRLLAADTGLEIEVVSAVGRPIPHDEILALHGRSRISIGLAIADGISTSFLEAIAMGSFPIQSNTACADEWIEDGITGSLVPPEDPNAVAAALRRAVADDALVDHAAVLNEHTVAERLRADRLAAEVWSLYERVAAGRIVRAPRRPARQAAERVMTTESREHS